MALASLSTKEISEEEVLVGEVVTEGIFELETTGVRLPGVLQAESLVTTLFRGCPNIPGAGLSSVCVCVCV